jgi:cyclopropane-fatty-acyl-phospholipid synthase
MIEAVGDEYLPEYFQSIHRLMAKNGVAVIQAITSPDSRYESFKNGVDFIQKHIFPGTLLPSVNAMVSACQKKTDLQLFNLRDIGLHYAKTLNMWEEQINENLQQVKDLGFDQAFLRKWKYYLNYCEAAFQERNISDVQITLIRPNNTVYKY